MPKSDAFAEKFRELLEEIPTEQTLKQWQYAYRQVIFLMGMQILGRFEKEAIVQTGRPEGPPDRARAGGDAEPQPADRPGLPVVVVIDSHGGGPGGGGNPTYFHVPCCHVFPDYPLALQELTESALRSER
jgi:hypothetical protein